MERYRKISKKELIKMIEEYPDDSMFVMTTNLAEKLPVSDSGKFESKTEVNRIANNSKTIIITGNSMVSHVDVHSVEQTDIENIRPAGVMKTILMAGFSPNYRNER